MKKVSVIIPNWNGEKLLEKNLPRVLKALPAGTEVIIIDNGSVDRSVNYLERIGFSPSGKGKLVLVKNKKNLGFAYACGQGVKLAQGEIVVLLNTDVIPKKGFLTSVMKLFADKKVFAVSFNERQFGWSKLWWRGGFIHHGVGGRGKRPHPSAWASGGSAAFRKSYWRKLNGFDLLYEPFYWEDFDLGFRAWANGWKVLWDPQAVVEHKHEASTSKVSQGYVSMIKERNQLLFIWKNITNPWWRLTHFFGLIFRVLMGPNYIKVIWAAIGQYRRHGRPKFVGQVFTDQQVVSLLR